MPVNIRDKVCAQILLRAEYERFTRGKQAIKNHIFSKIDEDLTSSKVEYSDYDIYLVDKNINLPRERKIK